MVRLGSDGVKPGEVLVVDEGDVGASAGLVRLLEAPLSGTGIEIHGAGVDVQEGSAMDRFAARHLRRPRAAGGAGGVEPRRLTAEMVRQADLVLCATREVRSKVVRLEPRGLRHTFGMLDFAGVAARLPHGPLPDGLPVGGADVSLVRLLVDAAIEHRRDVHARLHGAADLIDPYGLSSRQFASRAEEFHAAALPIVDALRAVAEHYPDRGATPRWAHTNHSGFSHILDA